MFGVPVMLGIPVIGSVDVATAVVFAAGSATAGTDGIIGAMGLTVGVTVMIGTGAAELTPRLPISVEPIGMPVRGTPPGVTADVGVVDAATLLAPAPHMLCMPEVSIRADVGGTPDDDIADVVDISGIDIALCDVPVPTAMPPPSKEAADPITGIPNITGTTSTIPGLSTSATTLP